MTGLALGNQDTERFVAFAERLADAAGAAILPYFRQPLDVENKGRGSDALDRYDPVTAADRAAEAAIRALIKAEHPTHGIWGEEEGFEEGTSPLTWVIDPIDGTRAFIAGLPVWGTLIALNDGTAPAIGIMDQPYTRERFVGWGTGARLGTRSLATRACPDLSRARVMTTNPHMFKAPAERAAFDEIEGRAELSRYGADCYAYCMLAMGFVDLVVEGALQPYDIQALIPIVEGAGGVVTSWTGGPADQGGLVVAAGDRRVHEQALAILSRAVG